MNFFRSEEHLRQWEGFSEKKKGGIIPVDELMHLFSGSYLTKRRDEDYFSHMGDYLAEMITSLDSLGNAGNFWRMGTIDKLGISLARKLGLMCEYLVNEIFGSLIESGDLNQLGVINHTIFLLLPEIMYLVIASEQMLSAGFQSEVVEYPITII